MSFEHKIEHAVEVGIYALLGWLIGRFIGWVLSMLILISLIGVGAYYVIKVIPHLKVSPQEQYHFQDAPIPSTTHNLPPKLR